ncbi:MAG: WD40 repeat domain-containing protein [Coriobacteriia bacterium]
MGEGTTPSSWRDIDRRHRAAILLGAAVVLAAVVAGAIALTGEEPTAIPGDETTGTITPAEQTAEATIPVPSYEPTTAQAAETSSTDGPGTIGPPPTPDAEGAAAVPLPVPTRVAYRREGWLCIAALDGSGEQRVAASESGVFSLSPDGTTIASVDGDAQLRLYDVASGGVVVVGPAERDRPSWAPDSAWLVYTAPGPKVTRVMRSGAGQRALLAGRAPAIARDGATVVASSPTAQDPAVLVWCGSTVERLAVDAPVTSIACSETRVFIGTSPGADGVATLRSISLGGTDERVEVRSSDTARGVSIGSLSVSPDGAWVIYAEQGDDDSSRVYALPVSGGAAASVSGRRDAYPLQWADAGGVLLFIEGNPMQGEPTALVSTSVTNGVRRLLVQGAGR